MSIFLITGVGNFDPVVRKVAYIYCVSFLGIQK